jgi:hypothetical protein
MLVFIGPSGANSGQGGGAIGLSAISVRFKAPEQSQLRSVRIEDLPVGATLSDGVHRFTASGGRTSVEVSNWNLAQLRITAPPGFSGSIALGVVASASERATGQSTQSRAVLRVMVQPVMVQPVGEQPVSAQPVSQRSVGERSVKGHSYTVDWSAPPPELGLGRIADAPWLADYFIGQGNGRGQDTRSLAQITGLVVKV